MNYPVRSASDYLRLLNVFWSLLRPQTFWLLLIYFMFGLAYGLALQDHPNASDFFETSIYKIISIALAIGFWYSAGTALNDYADFEIDRINLKKDKQRPLITGQASRQELVRIAAVSSIFCILLASVSGSYLILGLFAAMLVMNITYSIRPFQISRRGGLAPLLLPLGYVVLTVVSGMALAVRSYESASIFIILAVYVHFLSRSLLKDHRDVLGDAKHGKKTLILKYGNRQVVLLSMAFFIVSTLALSFALWPLLGQSIAYIFIFAGGAVYSLYKLMSQEDWVSQRPYITMFGRLCSGIFILLIFELFCSALNVNVLRAAYVTGFILIIIFWSLDDILRLQLKTTIR